MAKQVLVAIPNKYKGFIDEEISLVKAIYNSNNCVIDFFFVRRPNPKYYIPYDRVLEIKGNIDVDTIIIMDILKPRHFINLYRVLRREIIDRMQLILKIFALHAGSREAQLQIELARLRHELPLIKEAIRYAKLGELHGFLGGGRYGFEKHYTMAKKRMARIRREINELRNIREIRRRNREKLGYPHISIVGYTCAGKTTLFNRLTKQYKPVGPEPFTTLSPKASSLVYNGYKVILIDTVGFIRDIPPEIVEAFYATLEEVVYSDLIINVIDSSRRFNDIRAEIRSTREIFSHIGVHGKPIVYALNKIDLIDSNRIKEIMEFMYGKLGIKKEYIVPISAYKGININSLLDTIYSILGYNEE